MTLNKHCFCQDKESKSRLLKTKALSIYKCSLSNRLCFIYGLLTNIIDSFKFQVLLCHRLWWSICISSLVVVTRVHRHSAPTSTETLRTSSLVSCLLRTQIFTCTTFPTTFVDKKIRGGVRHSGKWRIGTRGLATSFILSYRLSIGASSCPFTENEPTLFDDDTSFNTYLWCITSMD